MPVPESPSKLVPMLFRAFYTIVLLSLSSLYVQPAAEISHTGIAPDSAQSSEAAGKADPAFPEKRMYREISPGPESCTGVVICSQAAVLEGGMSRAAIGDIGQNIYSTAASTRIAQEVQGATSQAARMLDAGLTGGSKWGSIYQKVQGSGRWYEALARGNAIDDIARDLLANNRYLTEAGAVFNKGSLINARNSAGNLLRPDIQIPLGKGTYGIIDITTAAQQSKIYKYASSQVKYLINVIY